MTILIVEDSPAFKRVIMNEVNGYEDIEIEESEDGKDALFIAKTMQIDFFIVDWMLPEMDGITLVKEVRKLDKYKNTPILMITSKADKKDMIVALKSGIDDIIIKPLKGNIIRDRLVLLALKKSNINLIRKSN